MNRRTLLAGALSTIGASACGARDAVLPSLLTLNHAAEGASLTNVARGARSWANHMKWGDGSRFTSLATNGTSVGKMLTRAATFDALFDEWLPFGRNIAWFWCEAPEMHLDGSGDLALLKQHIAEWVGGRSARGWRTVIKTVIPCGVTAGFELARRDVNEWIRSGAAGADFIDDWAAMWPGDAAAYPSLFEPDQIHTSGAGAQLGVQASSQPLCDQLVALAE